MPAPRANNTVQLRISQGGVGYLLKATLQYPTSMTGEACAWYKRRGDQLQSVHSLDTDNLSSSSTLPLFPYYFKMSTIKKVAVIGVCFSSLFNVDKSKLMTPGRRKSWASSRQRPPLRRVRRNSPLSNRLIVYFSLSCQSP